MSAALESNPSVGAVPVMLGDELIGCLKDGVRSCYRGINADPLNLRRHERGGDALAALSLGDPRFRGGGTLHATARALATTRTQRNRAFAVGRNRDFVD